MLADRLRADWNSTADSNRGTKCRLENIDENIRGRKNLADLIRDGSGKVPDAKACDAGYQYNEAKFVHNQSLKRSCFKITSTIRLVLLLLPRAPCLAKTRAQEGCASLRPNTFPSPRPDLRLHPLVPSPS